MERNLVTIIAVIFVILLIIVVLRFGTKSFPDLSTTGSSPKGFSFNNLSLKGLFSKQKALEEKPTAQPEQKPDNDKEYRAFIEKSKEDYRNLMERVKSQ